MSVHLIPCRRFRRHVVKVCASRLLSVLTLGAIAFSQTAVGAQPDLIGQCSATLKTTSMTAPMHGDFAAVRVAKSVGAINAQIETVAAALSRPDLAHDTWAALEQCRSALLVRRVELEERIAVLRTTGPVRVISGAEIKTMLTDVMIQGEQNGRPWTQMFNRDGSTSFSFGRRISDGRWKIEIDDYCSQWPPSEVWECWMVETRPNGFAFVSRATGEVWAARPYSR